MQREGYVRQNLLVCRAFMHMVEYISRQGRLEGSHRIFAAMHLICGLESV